MMREYEKAFAYNLRRLRKERQLTQRALAIQLQCSEKTVSKWECAAAIPSIDLLFLLANTLHTDVEGLFRRPAPVCYLGIDGGGTKTDLLLADADGKTLQTLRTGSCNPIDIGPDAAKKILEEAIFRLCGAIPLSNIVLFAGIAGGTSARMKTMFAEFFRSLHFRAAWNGTDNENIIAAGLHGRDGVTVIMGTGICAFSVRGKARSRVAGWGYLLDDGGSAYNLGRDALSAYYRALDGSGEQTAITQEIEAAGKPDPQELLGKLYDGGKCLFASYAPVAFAAAQKGDAVARQIIRRNTQCAARVIETAAAAFETFPVPVILAGGLTKEALWTEGLTAAVSHPERLAFELLTSSPAEGAVRIAMQNWKKQTEAM